jgi:membrane fusion protein (multidrug efflux system)
MHSRTIVALAAALAVASACSRKALEDSAPLLAPKDKARVEVRTARLGASGAIVVAATGTLLASQETIVYAEVQGRVARLLAEEGDVVKAGAPLVELDTADYQLNLRKSEADLKAAELTLAQTRLEYDRAKQVRDQGALAQAAFDGMQLKLDLTENGVRMAQIGLEFARRRMSQATIRAPYDALVVNRLASVGTLIQVMPPTPIYRIQDARRLRLKVRVPELSLQNVAAGDRVEARVEGAGRDLVAKVDTVIASIDPMSRTFEVVADVDNQDLALKPGAFATVRILHETGGLLLPREHVLAVPGRTDVVDAFVVSGGKVVRRTVKVRPVDTATLAVVEGIGEGEDVVTSDLSMLADGLEVVAKPVADAGRPASEGAR